MHDSLRLLLLSRMNGDAPALMKARRLDDSRAGWLLKSVEVALLSIRTLVSSLVPFVEAHLVQSFSSYS